jgi:L-iditol 2-dehydrogenase
VRAAVYRGIGELRVEELPVPEVGRGEMLLRVDVCGICGTDIKKVQKGLLPPPRIFGHEIAGTVARVGTGVSRFREGDRVVVHHHIPCGACFYCQRRAYAQCEQYKRNGTGAGFEPAGGGYAEFVLARDWIVERGTIPIPEGVSAEEACFVEPVNTCLKAVAKAGIEKGQTVLVVGQGPVGLLLMQLARWAGAEVVASDPMPDRRELSLRLGAALALDATQDVAGEVRRLTSGRGADAALVAAVGQAPFDQAVAATRPAGRVVVFAATSPGETVQLDLGTLCPADKDVLSSYSASVEVQALAARLVFGREVRVAELVTHRYPLGRAAEAMERAARPAPGVLKVVLDMALQGSGAA